MSDIWTGWDWGYRYDPFRSRVELPEKYVSEEELEIKASEHFEDFKKERK